MPENKIESPETEAVIFGTQDENDTEALPDSAADDELPPDGITPTDLPSDTDPLPDTEPIPDTVPGADAPEGEDELSRLRTELEDLRAALAERDASFARMSNECAEFSELFPDTPLKSVPDEVWQSVRAGIPLPAAYAYSEVRRRHREEAARIVNEANRTSSSGSLSPSSNDYYSPDEVRAMSAAEVRENYQKIINSMKMWN